MYIPALPRVALPEPSAAGADLGHQSRPSAPELRRLQLSLYDAIASLFSAVNAPQRHLRRRDPLQSSNVTIGAVVGVLLGVFIVGTVFFCVRYHRSIRFSESRRRRRRRGRSGGGSSRGSKASTSSGSTTAAPAPAPPPAPPAPPPAAAAAG